jgi:hypothetical protein
MKMTLRQGHRWAPKTEKTSRLYRGARPTPVRLAPKPLPVGVLRTAPAQLQQVALPIGAADVLAAQTVVAALQSNHVIPDDTGNVDPLVQALVTPVTIEAIFESPAYDGRIAHALALQLVEGPWTRQRCHQHSYLIHHSTSVHVGTNAKAVEKPLYPRACTERSEVARAPGLYGLISKKRGG